MKKYIFIFLLIFSFSVSAANTNVTNVLKCDSQLTGVGQYNGDDITNTSNGCFEVNTRFTGRLSAVWFYISSSAYDFSPSHRYTITLNMATDDWRNNFMSPIVSSYNFDGTSTSDRISVSNFRFVSMRQIKFDFTTTSSVRPFYRFMLYSTDYNSTNTTAITGNTNWNLSSVYINDNTSSSGSGSSGSGSSGSSISNNTLTCSNGLVISSTDYTYSSANILNSYLSSSGSIVSNNNYGIVNFIPIKTNTNYLISKTTSTGDVPSYCLSSITNSYGSCTAYNTNNSFAFNSGSNSYLSFSIKNDETLTLSTCVSSIDNQNQNTQEIIDNQNDNTTSIIDNNNYNTQEIIDNQNQNTQDIIKSNSICTAPPYVTTLNGYYLYKLGNDSSIMVLATSTGTKTLVYDVSNFDEVSFKFINYNRLRVAVSDVFTDERFFQLTLAYLNDSPVSGETYTFSTFGKKYMYMFLSNDSSIPGEVVFDKTYCKNGNEAINDTLTDDNVDSNVGSDFFDDFNSNDFGLSQIITIPLNTIQSLTSKSCVPLQVPIPFTNSNVTLPCMTEIYQSKFPSIYNLWKIVSFGVIAYLISIDIFHIVKGFKDPESDKVEVLDL